MRLPGTNATFWGRARINGHRFIFTISSRLHSNRVIWSARRQRQTCDECSVAALGDSVRARSSSAGAFVAELVLFDTLVVPQPPSGVTWSDNWHPAHQDKVLSRIPRDRLIEVSWDDKPRGDRKKRKIAADAAS